MKLLHALHCLCASTRQHQFTDSNHPQLFFSYFSYITPTSLIQFRITVCVDKFVSIVQSFQFSMTSF